MEVDSYMKFLKSKKQNNRLFLFVTAMDQVVIARPNFKINDDCWENLPILQTFGEFDKEYLFDTSVFSHLRNLLDEKKYTFLFNSQSEKNQILEQLGEIQLDNIYIDELNWLKRFGYYYHHTLAIAAFLVKFSQDVGLPQNLTAKLLEAAFLQDIGLSRLPYNVLFSNELFQNDDKLIMDQHTVISYLLIGYYSKKQRKSLGKIILNHHFPEKSLDSEATEREIIWMIYNMGIFDALINNRPFRPAYKPESALLYLKQLNKSLNLGTDIVSWLENKFYIKKNDVLSDFLVPYHPGVKSYQLN